MNSDLGERQDPSCQEYAVEFGAHRCTGVKDQLKEAVDEMGLQIGDGSWELKLLVTDLQVERTIRVLGDDHIGGVMIKLVDILDIAMDWSDHAVWWPTKNMWLNNTRCWMSAQLSGQMYLVVHIRKTFLD